MTQKERRVFLINYLKNEEESFKGIVIPHDTEAQKHLLRALMNVRPPMPVSKDFTDIQDEYLQQENRQRGIVSLGDLSQEQPEIYLWQGDITRLSVDAIVNATPQENFIFLTRLPQKLQRRPYCTTSRHTKTA